MCSSDLEVYVQALASRGGKHQVSNDGGTEPVWAKNGRELFFRNGDKMMGASISSKGDLLEAGKPHALFERKFATVNNPSGDAWYDVSPDGQRFLMLKTDDTGGASSIVIVQDWLTELKSRVAAK